MSTFRVQTPSIHHKKSCLQYASITVAYIDIITLSINLAMLLTGADIPMGALFVAMFSFMCLYLYLGIYLLNAANKRNYKKIGRWTITQTILFILSFCSACPPLLLVQYAAATLFILMIFAYRAISIIPVWLFKRELYREMKNKSIQDQELQKA